MKAIRSQLNVTAIAVLAGALAMVMPATAADEVSESRDLKSFSRILVEGAIDLSVEAGKKQSVQVTTDSRHIGHVTTTVEGDVLVISMKGRSWRNADVSVTISMKTLDGLVVEGAVDAELLNIDSRNFSIEIDGAADITITGICGSAEFQINGAGDLNAQDFKCKDVTIEINGAGDAEIFASASVEATINGVGDIDIYGDPDKVRPRIAGIGEIEVK
ncbi:MAG: DUF2807 domain-containing protein [Proteobacteria bacterium]|nr:DUF2807 domain-containing protein [Pseudomonadota bacterium]